MTCGMSPATLSSMDRRASHSQPGRGRALSRAVDSADILETAAVMSHFDLIVTVDTMVAHLAGALGRPAWTLLHSRPTGAGRSAVQTVRGIRPCGCSANRLPTRGIPGWIGSLP